MQIPPFIEKLTVRNFRSLRDVTVTFANPTFFVGKNASGKSNFIDAFAFLSDCMNRSLTSAIEERGGIRQLCYLFMELSEPIEFRVDFSLGPESEERGYYAFALEFVAQNDFRVVREQGLLSRKSGLSIWFERTAEGFRTNIPGIRPFITSQQLAISIVGGTEDFAPLMHKLTQMHTYALNADVLRSPTSLNSGLALNRTGSNIAGVLARFQDQDRMDRLNELLSSVVPGLEFSAVVETGDGRGVLQFSQEFEGHNRLSGMSASRFSDGTMKVLGLTTAVLQEPAPALVAVEEPEADIHPGALDSIADKINRAAQRSQIIITTHSPDLLDTKWIEAKHLRVVHWEQGSTVISELGNVPVSALRDHLMGAGELLRANALDPAASPQISPPQNLFEELT